MGNWITIGFAIFDTVYPVDELHYGVVTCNH